MRSFPFLSLCESRRNSALWPSLKHSKCPYPERDGKTFVLVCDGLSFRIRKVMHSITFGDVDCALPVGKLQGAFKYAQYLLAVFDVLAHRD